ncbi:MAG: hypothetical protein LBL41_01840 [Bifidobacteriaceae bacterium]|nr:hypothetical protein [Bifidobacteriaceae bacterium]
MGSSLQSTKISAQKTGAFVIINAVCLFVQVYVNFKFRQLFDNWSRVSELPFPASEYFSFWAFFMLYSITALALVCAINNKRMRMILTVMSAVVTVFTVLCFAVVV